jgi:hypothetical protein
METARIVLIGDRQPVLAQHRPGIQACVHPHDGDSRFAIAREDGALNRRGASPARQQRGVNVERTVRRETEERRRKQNTVGRDHDGVRPSRAPLILFAGAEPLRLRKTETSGERDLLDRARKGTHAAPGGPVRLRDDERNLVTCLQQALQRLGGEGRRAGED